MMWNIGLSRLKRDEQPEQPVADCADFGQCCPHPLMAFDYKAASGCVNHFKPGNRFGFVAILSKKVISHKYTAYAIIGDVEAKRYV